MRMLVVILTGAMMLALTGNAAGQDIGAVVKDFQLVAALESTRLDWCAKMLETTLAETTNVTQSRGQQAEDVTRVMRHQGCFDPYSSVKENESDSTVTGSDAGPIADFLPSVREVGSDLVVIVQTFSKDYVGLTAGEVLQERVNALPVGWRIGIKRIVLDLRGNLGGEIRNLMRTLEVFAPRAGMDFMQVRFPPGAVNPYISRVNHGTTKRPGSLANIPLTIIVNGNTASAAEWLVATLRYDWYAKQTTVVGMESTYGKGVVQCKNTVGGFELVVTCAHWKVAGIDIHGTGIEPDRKIDFTECGFNYTCISRKLDSVDTQHASQ